MTPSTEDVTGARRSRSSQRSPKDAMEETVATTDQTFTRPRYRASRSKLDEIDLRIIELLSGNGRLSTRAVAADTGLTEATVAARIRSLSERGILAVTAVLDWEVAGYARSLWLDVSVDANKRMVLDVAYDLAAIRGVKSVSVVFGPADLVVQALCVDEADIARLLTGSIVSVEGIHEVRSHVILETVQYRFEQGTIGMGPSADTIWLPAPAVELDDLDARIIRTLVDNGRQSNRAIGRDLGVSETTVRVRLRRLEEAGLLRIVAQSDTYRTRVTRSVAWVWIDVRAGGVRQVAQALAAMPEVSIVQILDGQHDLIAIVATPSRGQLVSVVNKQIRPLPGVASTSTWEIAENVSSISQWVRFV
jgi:DNA-binding Lrp family transcriptional regulator